MRFKSGLIVFLLVIGASIYGHGVISRTLIDFSQYESMVKQTYAETSNTYIGTNEDGNPVVVVGYNDYLLENWKVELNESANFLKNRIMSECKPVISKAKFNGPVLGVRIHFPTWNNKCYAMIKPPFPFQVYGKDGNYINVENGVIPNAWEIKNISIWVNGRNYNNQVSIRMRDRDSNIHEYFMGSLYFEGWRKLTWVNPNFSDKLYSKSLSKVPLYPRDIPYMVFDSIVIYRQGSEIGGDFVTYIGRMDISYTPYVVDSDTTNDINDEEVWQIIAEKGRREKNKEDLMLTEDMILYQQERYRLQIEKDGKR